MPSRETQEKRRCMSAAAMTVFPAPTGCATNPPRGKRGGAAFPACSCKKLHGIAGCVSASLGSAAIAVLSAASTALAVPKRPERRSPFTAAAATASASSAFSSSKYFSLTSLPDGNNNRFPNRTGSRIAPLSSSSPAAPTSTDSIQHTVRAWCGNKPVRFRTARVVVSPFTSSSPSPSPLFTPPKPNSRVSVVAGDGAAVGPSTNARSRSRVVGSFVWNRGNTVTTGSSASAPTVTITRAPLSWFSGTTKHLKCCFASAEKP